jgi:hypothetical protein
LCLFKNTVRTEKKTPNFTVTNIDWLALSLWVGHVALVEEERNLYRVLVGKPEVERPLGRARRRWEDGIKMDHREIGWGDVEWIYLAQDRDR